MILNQCILCFDLFLILLPRFPSLQNFLFVFLPGSWNRSTEITRDTNFLFSSKRLCRTQPETTCPCSDEQCALRRLINFSNLPSFPLKSLSFSTATASDKVAYSMLKHLPLSGMDFLLHIFNLCWSLHSFPSIWKTFSIIPFYKIEKPLDTYISFQPISLAYCVSKLFEHIILSRLLFFLDSDSIFSPVRPTSALDSLLSIKFCFFFSPF